MNPPQKQQKTGLARIVAAGGYSWKGLCAAWKHEAAFRQLCMLNMVGIPLALVLGQAAIERAILVLVLLITLIVELLNSAIEAVVDRISLEHHPLSGLAKDLGSAAQLIATGSALLIWLLILWR